MGKVRAGARVGGTTVCAYECVHPCARSRASLSPFQPPRYSLVAFSNRQFAVLQVIGFSNFNRENIRVSLEKKTILPFRIIKVLNTMLRIKQINSFPCHLGGTVKRRIGFLFKVVSFASSHT